jgi:hypothetical protein
MPSWGPDTAKQRLWLGSDRYRSRRRDTRTNAKCFADPCVKRYSLRRDDTNSDRNSYCHCNSDRNRNGYSDDHGFSYNNAQTDADAKSGANTETSSNTAAKTIVR